MSSNKKATVEKRFEKFRKGLLDDVRKLLKENEEPVSLDRKTVTLSFENLLGPGMVDCDVKAVSLMEGDEDTGELILTYILPEYSEESESFVPETHTEATLEHTDLSLLSTDELYTILKDIEL